METNDDNKAAPSVDVPRLVRRWRVRGICFVPCDLELEVEAESAEEAVREALTCPWQQSIDGNSMDSGAAFDWEPSAEEINPANKGFTGPGFDEPEPKQKEQPSPKTPRQADRAAKQS